MVREQEYATLLRVASDSIPAQRMQLVSALMLQDEEMTSKEAGDLANIDTRTATELLEDLWMLTLINRTGSKVFAWRLTDETTELLSVSNYFSRFSYKKPLKVVTILELARVTLRVSNPVFRTLRLYWHK